MKKTLSLLLAMTLLFCLLGCEKVIEAPEPVYTPEQIAPEDRERTGELEFIGLYFALYNDKTCELLGQSESANPETTISIPETCDGYKLVKICESALAESAFTEITLPDSITEIADYAFQKSAVVSLTLPANLKKIGVECFDGCLNLETVKFQSAVEVIPTAAFYGCRSLKELTLPEGVREIGEEAFASLKALEKLTLPESLETVGPYAFWSSGTETLEITVPAGVKAVGEDAFKNAGSGQLTYKGNSESVKAALAAQTTLK
ncbi:MAG: leucine-rich repeat domain-containing protein [Ruminococcaceae bacterium]|nr:leucine-rich repeat domain-containing protein [Oscillospiraceae bacterium]